MSDLIQRAIIAKRESKYVEFKAGFDPGSAADWVEITKDVVAIANSGGGVIIFGLDSAGAPAKSSLLSLGQTDPADFANKIGKYTGTTLPEFEIQEREKLGQKIIVFVIHAAHLPIIFQKPGTYDVGGGKQKTAFGVGTVYFRHGAKSEPGNSDDIRSVIERQLESIRRSWIKNVRKVVQAPQGSQIVTLPDSGHGGHATIAHTVHAVRDSNAMHVRLTRDREKATGSFVYEAVSEGIFDEINNVIDANRVLARGQRRFFLGQAVYYRIYAERQYVLQKEEDLSLLLHSSICDFYAPCLYWASILNETVIAQTLTELYLRPISRIIHTLLRLALVLDTDFANRLYEKWHSKWKGHSQPPAFYFAFKEMISDAKVLDPRLAALRMRSGTQLQLGKQSVRVEELLKNPPKAESLLTGACMDIFENNDPKLRSAARYLDLLAYAPHIRRRADEISRAFWRLVGHREAGDLVVAPSEE